VWFHGLIDRGLAGDPEMATFDWGLPVGVPATVENVAAHHPAMGHTQNLNSLRAAAVTLAGSPGQYARAYGNQATGGRERVIPTDAWDDARVDEDLPAGRPAYGVAVWEPRNGGDVSGSVVAAVIGPDGVPVVEEIETRPGRDWLVARVRGLQDAGQGVAIVRNGPAGPVADKLELAGVQLLPVTALDYTVACQDLWDRLCDADARRDGPRVRHVDSPVLDDAAEVAGRRFIGEGAWVWSPKASTGDTAALEAMTLAVRAVARDEPPVIIRRSGFDL
jgi:hypothetical protein